VRDSPACKAIVGQTTSAGTPRYLKYPLMSILYIYVQLTSHMTDFTLARNLSGVTKH